MKRISILATMVASALLYIAASAAGPASADVLCDELYITKCPTEHIYKVGSEFHSTQHGAVYLKNPSGWVMFACGLSTLDTKVTNAGGPNATEYPKVNVTKLTLSSCGEDSASILNGGNALISRYNFGGSLKGLFYWSENEIAINTHFLGKGGAGVNCTYSIEGPATLAGAKTEEGPSYESTVLKFNAAPTKFISGQYWLCPPKAYFTAQYDFDLELPKSVYVLKE
jgi:hypothetical protein